jgi:hypothetical protein
MRIRLSDQTLPSFASRWAAGFALALPDKTTTDAERCNDQYERKRNFVPQIKSRHDARQRTNLTPILARIVDGAKKDHSALVV